MDKVPDRALFSQQSERATACAIRMQIVKKFNVQDELNKAKQQISQKEDELQIKRGAGLFLARSWVSGQLRVQFGCKLPSKLSKERIKQGKQQIRVTKF